MFDTVVVGVDGRKGDRDAIVLARKLAAPGASATLTHVYGRSTSASRAAALALPVEEEAAERLPDERAWPAALVVRPAAVHAQSVARGLHRIAEERRADLLVIGSCHRGPLGRVLLGDDSQRALSGAPCAVAIAPRGYSDTAPQSVRLGRIGVGCESSREGARALEVAHVLAGRHRSAIEALSVVSLQSIPSREVPEQWPKIAGQQVVDELHRLRDVEDVEGDATYGEPGEELAAFSSRVDLLVIGSSGNCRVGRVSPGRTSRYLARHASCPLLVLPRSLERPAGEPSGSDGVVSTA